MQSKLCVLLVERCKFFAVGSVADNLNFRAVQSLITALRRVLSPGMLQVVITFIVVSLACTTDATNTVSIGSGNVVSGTSPAAGEMFGFDAASLGDINGDSYLDLAIGAPGPSGSAGGVRFVSTGFGGAVLVAHRRSVLAGVEFSRGNSMADFECGRSLTSWAV